MMDFVETLFADDLHAKRVLSLAHATSGVLRAGALGINAIGRGLSIARRTSQKHSVKQVDRLVGNTGIDVWQLLASWVPYVVADRSEVWVALDWTDFEPDGQATLAAKLISSHGRATPLVWLSATQEDLKGNRFAFEEKLLRRLKETLPATIERVVVLIDRGFGDVRRWQLLKSLGFDFVSRLRGPLLVTDDNGTTKSAAEWLPAHGKSLKLKDARLTEEKFEATFVAVKEPGMKDGWLLATSLGELPPKDIVTRYGRRFTIEESFRDIKDLRFGMGLSAMRVSTPERRDRLLLLSAMAIALLTLLGAAGEAAGIDRHFKTNTSKKRQYSLFRQGCDYYEFLPGMRDAWAQPLIEKFDALLRAQPLFADTLAVL